MSEEIVRKKKERVVVDETVELKIELSAEFFDNMDKAKKKVADQRGFDISYGEYIEEAMNDLVKMVRSMEDELIRRDYEDGLPEVIDKSEEEKPVDPSTGEVEEDVPPELYAHIEEDSAKEIMYV
jgi:hypothetical protein